MKFRQLDIFLKKNQARLLTNAKHLTAYTLSKKKFTDGLESIFTTPHGDEQGSEDAFLGGGIADTGGGHVGLRRPGSRKNFTTDLDSLLEEAMQESFEEKIHIENQEEPGQKEPQVFHQQAHRRRPMGGLDMLIRRTVEKSSIEEDESGTKRLTVTFDKDKLNKLKKIARLERAYLKDILGEIIEEFIVRYEKEKLLR